MLFNDQIKLYDLNWFVVKVPAATQGFDNIRKGPFFPLLYTVVNSGCIKSFR